MIFVDFHLKKYNLWVMKTSGYETKELNAVFSALADPTRRAILARLATGQATVSELADPFDISQPAISKHLKVLEKSGLIERGQDRQSRPSRLKAAPMKDALDWLVQFRRFWGASFEQLDDLLKSITEEQKEPPHHD